MKRVELIDEMIKSRQTDALTIITRMYCRFTTSVILFTTPHRTLFREAVKHSIIHLCLRHRGSRYLYYFHFQVKDNGHMYFISMLEDPLLDPCRKVVPAFVCASLIDADFRSDYHSISFNVVLTASRKTAEAIGKVKLFCNRAPLA